MRASADAKAEVMAMKTSDTIENWLLLKQLLVVLTVIARCCVRTVRSLLVYHPTLISIR